MMQACGEDLRLSNIGKREKGCGFKSQTVVKSIPLEDVNELFSVFLPF